VRNRQQFLGDNHLVSGIGYQECLDQKPENQSPEPQKLATTDPNHRSFVDAPETTHSELIKSKNSHHPYLADVEEHGHSSAGILTYTILDCRL
jgi:hypothetical protein